MVLTAVMMWHDEPVNELEAQIMALKGFADRLVAVDGRWEGFPSVWPSRSPQEQVDVVIRTARRAGLALTLHQPSEPWPGECHHRRFALSLARGGSDWLYLMDADERVTAVPEDFRSRLERTRENVVTVKFHTRTGPHMTATKWEKPGETCEQRRIFRNLPDMGYGKHHWFLYGGKPRMALWGPMPGLRFAKAAHLGVHVEHRTCVRTAKRWVQKRKFIPERDAADLARGHEL